MRKKEGTRVLGPVSLVFRAARETWPGLGVFFKYGLKMKNGRLKTKLREYLFP